MTVQNINMPILNQARPIQPITNIERDGNAFYGDILGEEMITNSGFAENADGWNLIYDDWDYIDGRVVFNGNSLISGYTLASDKVNIVEGKNYRLSFETSGAGGLVFCNCYPLMGESNVEVTAGSSYTDDFIAQITDSDYNVQFDGITGNFQNCSIDNVSLREIMPGWVKANRINNVPRPID
jgi:hypothetical protein